MLLKLLFGFAVVYWRIEFPELSPLSNSLSALTFLSWLIEIPDKIHVTIPRTTSLSANTKATPADTASKIKAIIFILLFINSTIASTIAMADITSSAINVYF